jgi:protein-S-isoprenylcysteine O-methyltransferase Ste14
MDDRFTKYSKLYSLVFLLFLAVPVSFALLIATFYGFSTLISSRPVDIFFELIVIGIPSAVFAAAHYIFFKRTKQHPSPSVKIISQILFVTGFFCSLFFLVLGIISYFKKGYNNITDYPTFHIAFLAGNIGGLFLIAIMQAFTTKKEEDWLAKRKKVDNTL